MGKVLRGENASPCTAAKFYVAIVQAVLLYGSESWTLSPALLARLEGFYIHSCSWMCEKNVPVRGSGGSWDYPRLGRVLRECGLWPIEVYIRRHHATIAEHIVCHPIFAECEEGEQYGSPRHSFWWEQELTLDEDSLISGYSSDGSASSQSLSSSAGDMTDG